MTLQSISVVIPAYNAAETIGAALDSACQQTVPPSEIIVIDDVSTDNTCAVVQKYIDDLPGECKIQIMLLRQRTNGGPAAARNAGIEVSRSEWIAFLDGDDCWLPHRLEVQLLIAAEYPNAALICSPTLPLKEDMPPPQECSAALYGANAQQTDFAPNVAPRWTPPPCEARTTKSVARGCTSQPCEARHPKSVARRCTAHPNVARRCTAQPAQRAGTPPQTLDSVLRTVGEVQPRTTPSGEVQPHTTPSGEVQPRATIVTLADFIYSNPVATSTVLVKRDILVELGGFDEQFRGPEDYDLWLRVVAEHKTLKTAEPLSLYRYVAGSLSMDDRTFLPQVLAVLDKAFSPGGVLHPYVGQRRRAYAEKYSSASWMAYNRGDRRTAFRHLARSYITYTGRIYPEERDPLLRIKLILRYLGLCSRERES